MAVPKTAALPLGDAPIALGKWTGTSPNRVETNQDAGKNQWEKRGKGDTPGAFSEKTAKAPGIPSFPGLMPAVSSLSPVAYIYVGFKGKFLGPEGRRGYNAGHNPETMQALTAPRETDVSGKDVREFLYTNMRAQRRYETDDDIGPRAPSFTDDQKDDRVLLLLGQLGERLVRSERERLEMKETVGRYSDLITALEAKVDRQAAAEDEMRARQEKIERDYADQMQKMQKAIVLAERIEEAINQQNRLSRRMEQITQDKARMLRKLERIEEAVVETQTALNAKSLVLVSDQNRAVNDPSARIPRPANQNESLWQNTLVRRLASTAAVFALIAGLSWGVYQSIPQSRFSQMEQAAMRPGTEDLLATAPFTSEQSAETLPTPSIEDAQAVEDLVAPESTAVPESVEAEAAPVAPAATPTPTPAPAAETTKSAAAEALNKSDDELVAMLNDDPDALASALNNIMPGAASLPQAMNDVPAPAAVTPPAAKATINDAALNDFLKAQKDQRPLKSRIQPDASLPSQIKTVEARAFEGIPEAQHDLAALYTAGQGGVKTDFARAAQWFEEAANNGVANARYNLGVLYHQGLGVTQDTNKALNWYKAAAAQSHPEAQYNLGIAYIEGVGTSYSPEKAAANFESAARAGIMEAAYNLGLIHENGLLGKPDVDNAIYWYNRAAENGSPEGKAALNQLARNLGYSEARVKEIYTARKAAMEGSAAKPQAATAAPAVVTPAAASATAPVTAPAAQPKSSNTGGIPVLPLDEEASYAPAEAQPVHQIVQVKKRDSAATTDSGVIAQIQEQLMNYGLYPGPADGRSNDVMADSIRSYQRTHDLSVDGRASEALLVHMMAQEMGSQE